MTHIVRSVLRWVAIGLSVVTVFVGVVDLLLGFNSTIPFYVLVAPAASIVAAFQVRRLYGPLTFEPKLPALAGEAVLSTSLFLYVSVIFYRCAETDWRVVSLLGLACLLLALGLSGFVRYLANCYEATQNDYFLEIKAVSESLAKIAEAVSNRRADEHFAETVKLLDDINSWLARIELTISPTRPAGSYCLDCLLELRKKLGTLHTMLVQEGLPFWRGAGLQLDGWGYFEWTKLPPNLQPLGEWYIFLYRVSCQGL